MSPVGQCFADSLPNVSNVQQFVYSYYTKLLTSIFLIFLHFGVSPENEKREKDDHENIFVGGLKISYVLYFLTC